MVGGIGMASMERAVLDRRDGRPVNAHMADYPVPVSLDIPQLEARFVDEADRTSIPSASRKTARSESLVSAMRSLRKNAKEILFAEPAIGTE